jgi:hypothetical protein
MGVTLVFNVFVTFEVSLQEILWHLLICILISVMFILC